MPKTTSKKPPVPEGVVMTKQRSYMSDVTVQLGLLNVACDFVAAKASDNSVQFKVICAHPDHGDDETGEAVKPAQRYLCEGNTVEDKVRAVLMDPMLTKAMDLRVALQNAVKEAHPPFTASEGARAREVDKVLHRVTKAQIEEVKGGGDDDDSSVIEGEMLLESAPLAEVQANVLPSGTVYRLRPRSGAYQSYCVLMDAIAEALAEGVATHGQVICRGDRKLFMLNVFTDPEGTRQIIAQETLRPGDLAQLDKVVVDYPESYKQMAVDIIKSQSKPFNADAYRNQRKARAAEMDEALRSESGTPVAAQAARAANPANGQSALEAMLQASLAQAKKAS